MGNVDTMQRYIYIHGIPDEFSLNIPRSKGCINMNNDEQIEIQIAINGTIYEADFGATTS